MSAHASVDLERDDECDFRFAGTFGDCTYCAGSGTVEVCANCYDDWSGCSVCQPKVTS